MTAHEGSPMADEEHKDYRSLGEILRDARTAKKQSVEELAASTKITAKAIRAIEGDDIDQLAGPVYARGFIRTLAESHGLDAEFLLTKLATASAAMAPPPSPDLPSPENPVKPPAPTPRTEVPAADPGRDEGTWHVEEVRVHHVEAGPSRPWLWWAVGAVVLVVLGVVLWSFLRPSGDGVAQAPDTTPAPLLTATADPGPPPGLSEGSRVRSPDPAAATEEIDATGDSSPAEIPASTGPDRPAAGTIQDSGSGEPENSDPVADSTPPPAPEVVPPDPDPVEETPVASTESAEMETDPARRNRLSSIVRPPDSERGAMELVVEAQGRVDVWIGADGGGRERHSLSSGETITLSARDHFSLMLSDPRAVLVRLDGQRRNPPSGLRGEWILYPDPQ